MEIPQEVIDYFLKAAKNMTLVEKGMEEGKLCFTILPSEADNLEDAYYLGVDDGRIEYARAFLNLYVPGWREM